MCRTSGEQYNLTQSVTPCALPLRPQTTKNATLFRNPYGPLYRFAFHSQLSLSSRELVWFSRTGQIAVLQTGKPELLVPIRLHLDMDSYKIREQLVWNVNDEVVSVCRSRNYFASHSTSRRKCLLKCYAKILIFHWGVPLQLCNRWTSRSTSVRLLPTTIPMNAES